MQAASWRKLAQRRWLLGLALGLSALSFPAAAAEKLTVGVLKLVSSGPVFIAAEKGWFAEEGLDVELKFFEAAQPVAVAVVSGDVDVGVTGLTGGFYNLAGKGGLKIIAAQSREEPGYKLVAFVASKRAADAGLRRPEDLPGHAAAITQIGSTFHYSLGLMAEKRGFDLAKVRLLPMQSIPNVVSAIKGGQVDAAIMPATAAMPLVNAGDAVLLGWADETPWQVAAVFTSPRMIASRRAVLEGFVRAYQRGTQAFYDAFLAQGPGAPAAGPEAADFVAIIAKATGQRAESVKASIPFIDPKARLLVSDIHRQIAWYQAQKLVDPGVDAKAVLDLSFVEGHRDAPK